MFDNNVFKKGTLKNVEEDGKVIGFEMETLITYYRGIPLSMIEYLHVAVDGQKINDADIRISLDKEDWFTLKEAETVTTYKWEYGESLYVRVLKDGGLSRGSHKVKLTVATRTAYIPVPLEGNKERLVEI
ncbi:DUF6379 domain-containing protein [Lactococcus cremoris]|uniref:C-glycoside deglycosidase beta subunit domain-containing protein n=1 Tax=Lactococcus lactis subsp. cremoris TaxID=1359 RepID=UPI002871A26F|nr:DUF6379 domain-containing protein [Lactococcus cremoris]MDR9868222.1 DUF6379 domain-containing protein [Lactococcus cremoris]